MDMNKFSERAREALETAQGIVRRAPGNQLGTEHLLIGVLSLPGGVVEQVFNLLGVDKGTAMARANHYLQTAGAGRVGGPAGGDQLYLTPRAKAALDIAGQKAQAMGDSFVGTEHLLLGILLEGDGPGGATLRDLGVTEEGIMKALQQIRATGVDYEGQATGESMLGKYTRDLTELARDDKLDPVIGRDEEIKRVIQVLSRRTKNNPVIIGEPGVGKTAIAEGLAQKVVDGDVPEPLRDKRVLALDLGGMVAGAKYRGEFEERLKGALDEIQRTKDVILFIDELHTVVGAGAAEGAMDASNMMKPMLARGELQCVGATTLDEYRKNIEKDAALERRFQPILVGEPTVEETMAILTGLRDKYEAHHKVKITDEAIREAAVLSDRYIGDRFLPDKAIDLLDEAASKMRIEATMLPPDLREMERRLQELRARRRRRRRGAGLRARRAAQGADRQDPADVRHRQGGVAGRQGHRRGDHRRRRHRRHREPVDRHPGDAHEGRRGGEAAQHGGAAARAPHRPGQGGGGRVRGRTPGARRAQGPQTADRLVPVPRTDGRGQDRARQGPGRVPLRRRERDGAARHERVHGEVLREPPRRLAARLRGLRGGRPAHRGGPPAPVQRRAVRRDREGAPGRVQHAAPGAGRRPAHRRQGPHGRLQEHRRDHDQQRRRRAHPRLRDHGEGLRRRGERG